ncbi:MAG: tyrosine--tRNA ligase, partial [Actinobacteria bacterium]|nr:tyrosine--tRNA ligase [Actinomycetota bacterium]
MPQFGDVVTEFASRGLIHDSTDRGELSQRSTTAQLAAYVGFDPTSDSLHIGNLLGQISLRRLQLLGHRPIVLAGGATGMVGDPSGRSEERNLLDAETLAANVANIKRQLERLLDFDRASNAATLVDNADWTRDVPVLEFLRDVGKHITVNQMMAKDSVKSRLADENGLSYTEFSYMLLQANDFRHLCEHHDCEMQMGGSDQWGNITAGIDLIRKRLGRSAFGLTWPLLTKSDGSKFGKTADGAVWLDPKKTSPYQFRQFWVQVSDDDIEQLLPRFSLQTLDEVTVLLDAQRANPAARPAQRALAREMTALVHGTAAADAADAAADILFGGDPMTATQATMDFIAAEVPATKMGTAVLADPAGMLAALPGVAASKSEARRLLSQKSVRINGVVLTEDADLHAISLLHERWLLVRKG